MLREWRQQLLIVGLVAIATAVAGFVAIAAYHASQPPSAFTGSATARLVVDDPVVNAAIVDSLVAGALGPVDISSIRHVSRDGSTLRFSLTDPPLVSTLGAEPVRVLGGRRPTNAGEVALTEPLAAALGASIDDIVPIDGTDMVVVGLMEDPANLGVEAGIVASGQLAEADQVSVLTSASGAEVDGLFDLEEAVLWEGLSDFDGERLFSVVAVYLLASVAMIEIALLCAAAFTVLSQRRLRQFGLLSAVGATSRQVAQTLRFNALLLGLSGGLLGVALGFGASLALRSRIEKAVGWRMDTWSLPLLMLLPLVAMAAATTVAGAWWPSRRLAQIPPVDALLSRRPAARTAGRKSLVGVAAFTGGAILLSFGVANSTSSAAVAGLLVAVVGVLLITPLLVTTAGSLAPHLPLSPRVALRDIARNQARSAACVAALVVVFGIPTAIIVTSASADANLESGPPNLPDNWAIISVQGSAWGDLPLDFSPASYQRLIDTVADRLPNAEITPIQFLRHPDPPHPRAAFLSTVRVSRLIDADFEASSFAFGDFPAWIATPELLDAVGADPTLAGSAAAVLGDTTSEVFVGGIDFGAEAGQPTGAVTPSSLDLIGYGAIAEYWIPESQVEATGTPIVGAWLITQPAEFTDREKTLLFDIAAEEVEVETQRPSQVSTGLRRNAAAIGGVITLAIVALTVSLLRAESATDQRVLTALGTGRNTRRRIAAATTAFLAFGGAGLALPAGYLALLAIMSDRSAGFPFVIPVGTLAALLVGTPLVATLGTYLLAGRHPGQTLARPAGPIR